MNTYVPGHVLHGAKLGSLRSVSSSPLLTNYDNIGILRYIGLTKFNHSAHSTERQEGSCGIRPRGSVSIYLTVGIAPTLQQQLSPPPFSSPLIIFPSMPEEGKPSNGYKDALHAIIRIWTGPMVSGIPSCGRGRVLECLLKWVLSSEPKVITNTLLSRQTLPCPDDGR